MRRPAVLLVALALAAAAVPPSSGRPAFAGFNDADSTPVELSNTALAFFKSGQWDKALDNMTRALGKSPDDPALRYNFALILFRMGRFVNARDEVKKVLRDHPRNGPALALYLSAIEGIKKSPGVADPEVLGTLPSLGNKERRTETGVVPEEVQLLLKALYADHDYKTVWANMAQEAQAALPEETYVKSSQAAWAAESKNGRTLDVKIDGFEVGGDRAMVRFMVMSERPTPEDFKEALGGDPTYTERVKEVIFFKKEGLRWRFFPASIFGRTLAEFHLAFRGVHLYAGVEINYKAQWLDKNLFFLDRIDNIWKRRNPAKAANARIMRRTLEYWSAIRRGDFEAAQAMLSKFSKNVLNIKSLRDFYAGMNLIDIQPGAVQYAEPNAACEFALVSLSIDPTEVQVNFLKLVSSLFLVFEDAEWKIVDYTQRKTYRDKKKGEVGGFAFAEDQFAVFNGRDWIDASADYRESMEKKLKELFRR